MPRFLYWLGPIPNQWSWNSNIGEVAVSVFVGVWRRLWHLALAEPAQDGLGGRLVEPLVVLTAAAHVHAREAALVAVARLEPRLRGLEEAGELDVECVGHADAAAPPLKEKKALRVLVAIPTRALAAEVRRFARDAQRREANGQMLECMQSATGICLASRKQSRAELVRQLHPHGAGIILLRGVAGAADFSSGTLECIKLQQSCLSIAVRVCVREGRQPSNPAALTIGGIGFSVS